MLFSGGVVRRPGSLGRNRSAPLWDSRPGVVGVAGVGFCDTHCLSPQPKEERLQRLKQFGRPDAAAKLLTDEARKRDRKLWAKANTLDLNADLLEERAEQLAIGHGHATAQFDAALDDVHAAIERSLSSDHTARNAESHDLCGRALAALFPPLPTPAGPLLQCCGARFTCGFAWVTPGDVHGCHLQVSGHPSVPGCLAGDRVTRPWSVSGRTSITCLWPTSPFLSSGPPTGPLTLTWTPCRGRMTC